MTHVPLKCGYICVICRESHIKEKCLMTTACPCNGDGLHTTVLKRAVQCQNCNGLSDDPESFKKQVCYGRRPGSQPVSEAATPRSLPTTSSETPPKPSPQEADAYMELRMAELEMGRLLLLESVEKERKKLNDLIAQKQKATTGLVSR